MIENLVEKRFISFNFVLYLFFRNCLGRTILNFYHNQLILCIFGLKISSFFTKVSVIFVFKTNKYKAKKRSKTTLKTAQIQRSDWTSLKVILYLQPQILEEKDKSGKTAVHYCAENQNLNCIEQIISADPNLLNEADEEGYTPLHLAVISGNSLIVNFLISKGADVNAVDNEHHSAVHWATGKRIKHFLIWKKID